MQRYGFLRKVLFWLTLEMGALLGMPIRPDEIEKLMRNMNQPKIVRTNPDEGNKLEDMLRKLFRIAKR